MKPLRRVSGSVVQMDERLQAWKPSVEELERIIDEMRPIIAEFTRRAEVLTTAAAAARAS
jgi:hypothetical protein